MDSAVGQGGRPSSAAQGAATRAAILEAAAALIADLGWGQVTTRAIAARAGVPHGAVNYHFQGKDDLLRQAAIAGTLNALAGPLSIARAAGSVQEVLDGILAWFTCGALNDPSVALLLETARQSTRDPLVREPLATKLREFRATLTELVRRSQERGDIAADSSPAGTATMVAALLDGLMLHVLLDPELDLSETADTIRSLLRGR
ncbi:TetR/AcrR family transcriptional regulator [Actinomadura spongiicola]|uniref:TetR/AcrR family transcriptional regulator n=1 Tax=Actinomadura spongiicola TaxID=2303421 RepID=A0A372GA17_9ACTN|nr:TetR/AcrR family transcriptional regulator [Actinomadura spongiicola]RFS82215.1 TetR/AcrR family transcriptional regulator [Actinomadura spongiicola]